jgi:serpin B
MVLIVPDEGSFATYEQGLSIETVQPLLDELGLTRVELTMPKFSFESQFSLSDALKTLGMPAAFDSTHPDFAAMNARASSELFIQAVVHKANITLDEHGTEAAAATGVVGGVTSLPPGPVQLDINRPFLFLIRDDRAGAILFTGRVVDPTAS